MEDNVFAVVCEIEMLHEAVRELELYVQRLDFVDDLQVGARKSIN